MLILSGGVPYEDVTSFEFKGRSIGKGIFKTEINCNEFVTNRTIDFADGVIENDFMQVYKKGEGIGLNLFINQVKEARLLGFNRLKVHAVGGDGWLFFLGKNRLYNGCRLCR